MSEARWALRLAELVVRTGRAIASRTPTRVRERLEDRLFYVIFQRTRVENDAYGWRPDVPGGGAPPASALRAHGADTG